MIKIKEVIIVEGKYDKNTLGQVVDATIVQTDGFAVFNNKDRLSLIRKMAQKRGIIIFTDGDGAGFVIRNFLKGAVDNKLIKHAFVPDIFGKEKRKDAPSKEGKLGLEGMKPEIIIDALKKCGATIDGTVEQKTVEVSPADFYTLGLSGGANSAEKREKLKKKLGLPQKMSSKGLFGALEVLVTRDELFDLVEELFKDI